jgi:hypothetical protein
VHFFIQSAENISFRARSEFIQGTFTEELIHFCVVSFRDEDTALSRALVITVVNHKQTNKRKVFSVQPERKARFEPSDSTHSSTYCAKKRFLKAFFARGPLETF